MSNFLLFLIKAPKTYETSFYYGFSLSFLFTLSTSLIDLTSLFSSEDISNATFFVPILLSSKKFSNFLLLSLKF